MYEIYAGERESGVNGLFATPKSLHESSTRLEQHCNRGHKTIKVTNNLRISLSVVAGGRVSHEKWHYFYAEASY